MTASDKLFLQLQYIIFLVKTIQKLNLSRLQRKIVLQKFGQYEAPDEMQCITCNEECRVALEDIYEQFKIHASSNVPREKALRNFLLERFTKDVYSNFEAVSDVNANIQTSFSQIKKEIEFLKSQVAAYKLYETLLKSIRLENDLFVILKKVVAYVINLDFDDTLSLVIFLKLFPKLIRRLAATSKYTQVEITNYFTNELALKLIQSPTLKDLHPLDFTPVSCFIERYLILYRFSGSYTLEKLLAQACHELNNDNKVEDADNLLATIRLKAYSIVQSIFESNAWMPAISSGALEGINLSLEKIIDSELKEAWLALERSYKANTDSEPDYLLLDNIKHIKDYLNVSLDSEQKIENQNLLKLILERAAQNGMLGFWVNRVDCLIIEELKKIPANLQSSKLSAQLIAGESNYSSKNPQEEARKRHELSDSTEVRKKYIKRFHKLGICLIALCSGWLVFQGKSCLTNACNSQSTNDVLDLQSQFQPYIFTNLWRTEAKSHPPQWNPDSSAERPTSIHSPSNSNVYLKNLINRHSRLVVQRGFASWSGDEVQSQVTASGERFDKRSLTASHASFPFETKVRVKDLGNNREVIVRINDRFPQEDSRIINLSEAAAQALGITNTGIVQVQIEAIE
ncbi:septal ring lytic transglycosylase RlpA family protein [Phormidium tenue FACHB-886]|nr:septal ring lytic transglycosylase RlpA family protein [Phormidium tenue FACHB-886]